MREEPPTLRITAKDIDAGWIRIPSSAKRILAADRADTIILLRGMTLRACPSCHTDNTSARRSPTNESGVADGGLAFSEPS